MQLVVAAAVPCEHGPLGCRVLRSGKDYFTDKTPFTTLEQLDQAHRAVNETGRKYVVYFNERIHSECSHTTTGPPEGHAAKGTALLVDCVK